jgi:hypothetical protein
MPGAYIAVGADISVNHGAVVVLDEAGRIVMIRYLCQKVKDTKAHLGGARCIPKAKRHATKARYEMERLVWLRDYYDKVTADIVEAFGDVADIFVGLEAYAYSAGRGPGGGGKAVVFKSRPYQIGETAGIFKLACKDLSFGIRLHDPASVKIFACDRGNASKEEVREAVEKSIAADPDTRERLAKYPQDEDVMGDIIDALVLARMARAEARVRLGTVEIKDLDPGPRRVFLRTTKTNPVNLLDRPWL